MARLFTPWFRRVRFPASFHWARLPIPIPQGGATSREGEVSAQHQEGRSATYGLQSDLVTPVGPESIESMTVVFKP